MTHETYKQYLFQKKINLLKNKKGIQSELITFIIPQKTDLNKASSFLAKELNEVSNIKNKTNRKAVESNLQSILSWIRTAITHRQTFEKGLGLFASGEEVIFVEPKYSLLSFVYYCDKVFHIDSLTERRTLCKYGVLVMDRSEATMAVFENGLLENIKSLESYIPNKTRKGGQSARRYCEIIKNESLRFFEKISEHFDQMINKDYNSLNGIFFGSIIPTKDEFIQANVVNRELVNRITTIESIQYSDESGLKELLRKNEKVINEKETEVVESIVRKLAYLSQINQAVIGFSAVLKLLKNRQGKLIYLSEQHFLDSKVVEELEEYLVNSDLEVRIIPDPDGSFDKFIEKLALVL